MKSVSAASGSTTRPPIPKSSTPRWKATATAACIAPPMAASPGNAATPPIRRRQYYAKVEVDPANPDRVYIMGVNIAVSDDGGRTSTSLGTRNKHVDNHDIWVDPQNNNHYLVGCDGGLYESFDRASTWIFKENLPTGQFYDVAVDEDAPFYHVYGGTQDNNSVGCAVRTKNTVAHQRRLLRHQRRRWILFARRSQGSQHHLCRQPERRHRPLRQAYRRARLHPAAARQGRSGPALELGCAVHDQPALQHAASTSARRNSIAATIAAIPGLPSAPTSPANWTATSCP